MPFITPLSFYVFGFFNRDCRGHFRRWRKVGVRIVLNSVRPSRRLPMLDISALTGRASLFRLRCSRLRLVAILRDRFSGQHNWRVARGRSEIGEWPWLNSGIQFSARDGSFFRRLRGFEPWLGPVLALIRTAAASAT